MDVWLHQWVKRGNQQQSVSDIKALKDILL
jgi:hypothetical protein